MSPAHRPQIVFAVPRSCIRRTLPQVVKRLLGLTTVIPADWLIPNISAYSLLTAIAVSPHLVKVKSSKHHLMPSLPGQYRGGRTGTVRTLREVLSSSQFVRHTARRYLKFVHADWIVPMIVAIRTLSFKSSKLSDASTTTSLRLQD